MKVHRTITVALFLATALPSPAGAAVVQTTQDVSGAPDADGANAAQVDQVGSQPSPHARAPAGSPLRAQTPVKQLSSPGESAGRTVQLAPMRDAAARGEEQLTSEAKSVASGPQLYRGGRTAQSSTPLSTRADGKPQGTVRLAGKDRCDPRTGADAGKKACSNVIESRADEFHRPTPPTLSPEQKLLIDENIRERGSLDMLVRQVGRNDVDADAPETQGLASVVLAPTPPADKPADADAAAGRDTGALVQAFIDTINSAPQH